jgi:hypothetical protein
VALQAGCVSERGGKVALAQTDCANKNDVALRLQKREPEQVTNLQLVDVGGPTPVELFERFQNWKAGRRDTPRDTSLVAPAAFAVDQARQVVNMRRLIECCATAGGASGGDGWPNAST